MIDPSLRIRPKSKGGDNEEADDILVKLKHQKFARGKQDVMLNLEDILNRVSAVSGLLLFSRVPSHISHTSRAQFSSHVRVITSSSMSPWIASGGQEMGQCPLVMCSAVCSAPQSQQQSPAQHVSGQCKQTSARFLLEADPWCSPTFTSACAQMHLHLQVQMQMRHLHLHLHLIALRRMHLHLHLHLIHPHVHLHLHLIQMHLIGIKCETNVNQMRNK